MNREAIGAVAELVGALGIIATLAYLAAQIRQNSRVTSVSAGHSIANQIATFLERLALDPEINAIWSKGISSPSRWSRIRAPLTLSRREQRAQASARDSSKSSSRE